MVQTPIREVTLEDDDDATLFTYESAEHASVVKMSSRDGSVDDNRIQSMVQ